jgi:auxin efflux carrier family protein
MGAHKWIAMDYIGPEVEDVEIRKTQRLRWKAFFNGKWLRSVTNIVNPWGQRPKATLEVEREEMGNIGSPTAKGTIKSTGDDDPEPPSRFSQQHKINQGKHISFHLDDTTTEYAMSPTDSLDVGTFRETTPVVTVTPIKILSSAKDEILPTSSVPKPRTSSIKRRLQRAINIAFTFFRSSLESPASLSIIVSFIISLVPPLKALFVPGVPGTHIPSAPDGLPPLSFLIDTASFIGAASVPLGLICLGSALARLKLPNGQWSKLPLGAIGGLAVGKILIMPVLGVLICQGLTNVGVIDKEDRVLRFVCM